MLVVNEIGPNDWVFESTDSDGVEEEFHQALDMWDAGDALAAEAALRAVIAKVPQHIDAIHHLGLIFAESGRDFEAFLSAKEAVEIGLSALPPTFSWLTSRLNWGHLSNRPFMRAYHALGLLYLQNGAEAAASEIFARLVSVHPNDNLGARYLLMRSLLIASNWESALQLAARYPDSGAPDMTYSRVVALAESGREAEAIEALREAVRHSPLVARELLKKRHTKPDTAFPGMITVGGADEAYDYWERHRAFWRAQSPAMKILKQVTNG